MKTFRNTTTLLTLAVLALSLSSSAGCGGKDFKPSKLFSLDSAWPFESSDEPEEGTPVRLVGAWTDTVMTKSGQKAQRGFGGRLMFYEEDSEKPILVDGQLVVYAFDETTRTPTDNKPTRRYVFPPEQMKLHMSKSDVGASYSFWLPWDEVGGARAEVSLICRFESKAGPVITGEQTRHMLPGTAPAESVAENAPPPVPEGEPMRPARQTLESMRAEKNAQAEARFGAQQASYETTAAAQAPGTSGVVQAVSTAPQQQMTVTSIALPQNFRLPDGSAQPQPIPGATSTMIQQQPAVQPAQPAVPGPHSQPAPGPPIQQAMQPPITHGSSSQSVTRTLTTASAPETSMQAMVPATTPAAYAPSFNGLRGQLPAPQFLASQPMPIQGSRPYMTPAGTTIVSPGAQPAMMPQQIATIPYQQPAVAPQQPVMAVPQSQVVLPGAPQMPAAGGYRTTVSYPQVPTLPVR